MLKRVLLIAVAVSGGFLAGCQGSSSSQSLIPDQLTLSGSPSDITIIQGGSSTTPLTIHNNSKYKTATNLMIQPDTDVSGVTIESTTCGSDLGAGEDCTVTFAASSTAQSSGNIVVTADNFTGFETPVTVTGLMITEADDVLPANQGLNFKKLNLQNTTASQMSFNGANTTQIHMITPDAFHPVIADCQQLLTLSPGASCQIWLEASDAAPPSAVLDGTFAISFTFEGMTLQTKIVDFAINPKLYAAGGDETGVMYSWDGENDWVAVSGASDLGFGPLQDLIINSYGQLCFSGSGPEQIGCFNGSEFLIDTIPSGTGTFSQFGLRTDGVLCAANSTSNSVYCRNTDSTWAQYGDDFSDLNFITGLAGLGATGDSTLFAAVNTASPTWAWGYNQSWASMSLQPDFTDALYSAAYINNEGNYCMSGYDLMGYGSVACYVNNAWITQGDSITNAGFSSPTALVQKSNNSYCAAAITNPSLNRAAAIFCADTSGHWSQVGGTLSSSASVQNAGVVYNHGLVIDSNDTLYAAGRFNQVGSTPVGSVVQSSGSDLVQVADGLSVAINGLALISTLTVTHLPDSAGFAKKPTSFVPTKSKAQTAITLNKLKNSLVSKIKKSADRNSVTSKNPSNSILYQLIMSKI